MNSMNLKTIISKFHSKLHGDFFIWRWVNNLFNKVDTERLEIVGPDRSCAEWILKNGGAVKFKIQSDLITDYNDLAPDTSELVRDHLVEIYANRASLTDIGFNHFKNCQHITKITLISCHLIEHDGLLKLQYLKESLKYLEISSCNSIVDRGIFGLTELRNLNKLILHNLPSIMDKSKCEMILRESLKTTDLDIRL